MQAAAPIEDLALRKKPAIIAMAAKHVAAFVVVVAILGAIFPQYFKFIFLHFGGLVPPILNHSTLLQIFSTFNKPSTGKERLFTRPELSTYDGEKGSAGLYLSILGRVYDVGKGKKHYGPGGGYHGFAGRDGSASFATGDFSDSGLTKNVLTLSESEVKAIWDWIALYDREYIYKGKLIGQFYDSNGNPTLDYYSVRDMVKQADKANESKQAGLVKFPPCNMEWSAETGSRVWCSRKSGGIDRDWVGVPRKYYEPGAESYRCACIPPDAVAHGGASKGMLQEYDACRPTAESCFIKPEN